MSYILILSIPSLQMRWIARALLANQHGGPLAQLAIAPRQPPLQRTLGAIVVHTAVIFQSRQGVELLEPFVKMLNNPAALVVCIHGRNIIIGIHLHFVVLIECLPANHA